jgi:ABC-type glutathione transport system ATPase component
MGATAKVFDNPQHEYTRMLLTSVPQLHKKWEAAPEGAPDSERDSIVGGGRPGRYSKSSLHPLGGRHSHRRPRAEREAAENLAAEGLLRTDTYLRTHEEIPPLVEVEDDHLVAIPLGAR